MAQNATTDDATDAQTTTVEFEDDDLESLKDLIAYVGGRIPEEHYAQRENFNAVRDALNMDHLDDLDVPDEWRVETDGGAVELDYPRTYDATETTDLLDDLRAGDRILWGDRSVPCVVARVVEPNDPIGQSLTASVLRRDPETFRGPNHVEPNYAVGRDLEQGDVFLSPTGWNLTGRRFAVVHGPRGGFYAVAEPGRNHSNAAVFRVVRSYHKTKMGRPGEGAWSFDAEIEGEIAVVESGDAPDDLDEDGDLPRYEDIQDRTLVAFDSENEEVGHVEVGTVAEAFEEGLQDAHYRALDDARDRAPSETDEEAWTDFLPTVERVEGTPDGYSHGTVTVEGVFLPEEDDAEPRAVLDTPAPWNTPDDETPANEAIKETPYGEVQYEFDDDRGAWILNALELVRVASTFRFHGYAVRVADDAYPDE